MILDRKNVSKFDEEFIKNYDENSDKGYILEVICYNLEVYVE